MTHDKLIAELSEKVKAIDWFQFEKLVGLLYEDSGYSVERIGGAKSDGGVDLIVEKPGKIYEVSMGIYIIRKNVLKYIPNNKFFGFDNLMHKLLKLKKNIKVLNHSGYWLDIGKPEDYIQATEQFKKMKKKLLYV